MHLRAINVAVNRLNAGEYVIDLHAGDEAAEDAEAAAEDDVQE